MPLIANKKPVMVSSGAVEYFSSNLNPATIGITTTIARRQLISKAMVTKTLLGLLSDSPLTGVVDCGVGVGFGAFVCDITLQYTNCDIPHATWALYFTKYSGKLDSMSDNKITVYSAVWCGFCHQAKQYFDSIGVAYTAKDVEKEPEAGLEAATKSGQRGIPVIDIDGEIIVGFNRPQIDKALAAHSIK